MTVMGFIIHLMVVNLHGDWVYAVYYKLGNRMGIIKAGVRDYITQSRISMMTDDNMIYTTGTGDETL